MMIYTLEMILIGVLAAIIGVGKTKDARKRYVVAVCIMLTLVSGLRSYTVGVDTLQYWNAYLTAWADHSWYESGFLWLLRALNSISENPQLLLFFTSVVMTGCVGYAICRFNCNPIIAFFLYITLLTYATFMNLMRQGLAAAILVAALPWLASGKRLRFVFAVLISSLFHSTAIVMLALVPLTLIKPSRRIVLGYGAGAIALAISPDFIWSFIEGNFDKYSTYSASAWSGGNTLAAPLMTIMDILLLAIAHVFGGCPEGAEEEERVLFHGTMLQISFQFLACFINIFQRLTTYTSIFLVLYTAQRFLRVDTKLKFLVMYFIFGVTTVFFFVIMIYRPEWHGVVPFSFFWQ